MDEWFFHAAKAYIETKVRHARTFEEQAAALDVGRETWRTWRAKLQKKEKTKKG